MLSRVLLLLLPVAVTPLVITEVLVQDFEASTVLFSLNLTADGRVSVDALLHAAREFVAVHRLPPDAVSPLSSVIAEAIDLSQMRGAAAAGLGATVSAGGGVLSGAAFANLGSCGGLRPECDVYHVGRETPFALRSTLKSLKRLEVKFWLQLQQLQADIEDVVVRLRGGGDSAQGSAVVDATPAGDLVPKLSRPGFPLSTPDEDLRGVWSDPGPVPAPSMTATDDRGRACVHPPQPLPDVDNCIVLFWTEFYWGEVPMEFTHLMTGFDCASSCTWTNDRRAFDQASALVFHDWEPNGWPPLRYCNQKWIRLVRESPSSRPVGYTTVTRRVGLATFDALATYNLDSDIPYPYFPYGGDAEAQGLFNAPLPWAAKRSDVLIAWVARNCQDASNRRTDTVLELMSHMPVHSYGRCLHNVDFPDAAGSVLRKDYKKQDMEAVLRTYKFALVVENSNCVDYVTEKLWRAFRMGVVPVYVGAPNLRDFEPLPGAVIRVSDFRSLKELAGFLTGLAADKARYEHYLHYKTQRKVSANFHALWMTPRPDWQCRVCEWVAADGRRQFWEDRSCSYTYGHY